MSIQMGMNLELVYQGQNFHIQTEDSGLNHPMIITHLFKGGRILHTQSQEYTQLLESETLDVQSRESQIRQRMKDQHLTMLRELESGALDRIILTTPSPSSKTSATASVSHQTQPPIPLAQNRRRSSLATRRKQKAARESTQEQLEKKTPSTSSKTKSVPSFQLWQPFIPFQGTFDPSTLRQCTLSGHTSLTPKPLSFDPTQLPLKSQSSQSTTKKKD